MCAAETRPTVPTHWTYKSPEGDLCQGDVLKKTDVIRAVLEQVHPHYLKDDYTHFVVLTQTCDLVRREGGRCGSRYITLAAVRPLEVAVRRELLKYQKSELERLANASSSRHRARVGEFLTRLFNNNERDYFYLHEDVALGLSPSSCTFLQLSIAVRAAEHYETCLQSRIASMTDIFGAKLGWLVGNLYSRVGTEDWTPVRQRPSEFSRRISTMLEASCHWVDDEQLKVAVKSVVPAVIAAGKDAARRHIDGCELPPRRERLIRAMERVLQAEGVDAAGARKLVAGLKSDPEIAVLIAILASQP